MNRRPTRRVVGGAALGLASLLLLGCGNDSSGPSKNAALFQYNAQFNGGRTVRWPSLPVKVYLGNGVANADEVTTWTGATGAAVTFIFVGSAGGANIVFGFRSGTDICGVTTLEYTDAGEITSADVQVSQSIYRGPQCQRTVTHETAHAIGFFDHTSDGGLMDPDGGNGVITSEVSQMLRDLYRTAPNTQVSAQVKRQAERRQGRNVMTFIYPAKRP